MGIMKRLLEDPALLAAYREKTRQSLIPTSILIHNDNDRDLLDDFNSDIYESGTYFGQSDDFELVEGTSY